jgi:hypothetical protein
VEEEPEDGDDDKDDDNKQEGDELLPPLHHKGRHQPGWVGIDGPKGRKRPGKVGQGHIQPHILGVNSLVLQAWATSVIVRHGEGHSRKTQKQILSAIECFSGASRKQHQKKNFS